MKNWCLLSGNTKICNIPFGKKSKGQGDVQVSKGKVWKIIVLLIKRVIKRDIMF